jgi:hypothetical protein
MPEPWLHTDQGRRFLVTETQRRAGDPPLRRVQIALRGIPGQGNARWFAAATALGLLIAGAALSMRKRDSEIVRAGTDFEAHKAELLRRARAAQAQHQAGETGPEYYSEQIAALTEELAELLFEQAALQKRNASTAGG